MQSNKYTTTSTVAEILMVDAIARISYTGDAEWRNARDRNSPVGERYSYQCSHTHLGLGKLGYLSEEIMYDLLKYLTSSLTIIGALTYLARKYFEGFFSKDLELFKHSLSNESESFKQSLLLQTENFRANLQERQLVFGQLYQKRASILGDIYALMIKANTSMETFVRETDSDNERSREAKFREAAKAVENLQDSVQSNRIWLSEDLSKKIDAMLLENDTIVRGYNSALKLRSEGLASDFAEKELLEIWDRVDKEMPIVRASLEKEFRTLLGVEENIHALAVRSKIS